MTKPEKSFNYHFEIDTLRSYQRPGALHYVGTCDLDATIGALVAYFKEINGLPFGYRGAYVMDGNWRITVHTNYLVPNRKNKNEKDYYAV